MLDDIKADPNFEYARILRFLDLPDYGKQQFPVQNAAKALPFWAARLSRGVIWAKGRLNIRKGFGVNRWLVQKLYRPGEKDPIGIETLMELQEYFKKDIALLSDILERDFSDWLKY